MAQRLTRLAASAGSPQVMLTPSDAKLSYWLYGALAFCFACDVNCLIRHLMDLVDGRAMSADMHER